MITFIVVLIDHETIILILITHLEVALVLFHFGAVVVVLECILLISKSLIFVHARNLLVLRARTAFIDQGGIVLHALRVAAPVCLLAALVRS